MSFFGDTDYYTGPPLTNGDVEAAEQALGYRLPASYVGLLRGRNGGTPRHGCFPTRFPTTWASDHVAVAGILGLGSAPMAIDGELGSRYMIAEWGYPDIGLVVCDTPSGGHDTVMLDYSTSGPSGEPSVAYVDEDRVPRQLAPTFADFLEGLRPCDEFTSSE